MWPGDAGKERTTFGQLNRAQLMARVKSSRNKTTEIRLIGLLRRARITGWRRNSMLVGRPDFVFRESRLAVFLDGCFWHGHDCRNLVPKTNSRVWQEKIVRNKKRDRVASRRLRTEGWTVLRIWECELAKKPTKVISQILMHLP